MKPVPSQGKEAFLVHREVLVVKNDITKNFLHLGVLLHLIKEKKLYLAMDYNSFATYVNTPEISISLSSAYSLIDIYRTFTLQLGIPDKILIPIGRKKLEIILPLITEENKDDWMAKAETLPVSALLLETREDTHTPIFEYKYTKQSRLAFKGDTTMERLLEARTTLVEYHCSGCDMFYWVEQKNAPHVPVCPFNVSTPHPETYTVDINGEITYKDLKEN